MRRARRACSFCKRAAAEVRYLVVAVEGAAICNECALVSLEALVRNREPELAGLLERELHLIQFENPVVTTREFKIRMEYRTAGFLILGFVPAFLKAIHPEVDAICRIDATAEGMRLSVRSDTLSRDKIEEALTLYGDVLIRRKEPPDLRISAKDRLSLERTIRAAEENCFPIAESGPEREYAPVTAIGWILARECEDHEGLLG